MCEFYLLHLYKNGKLASKEAIFLHHLTDFQEMVFCENVYKDMRMPNS
jgi:hypothetical protein